MPPHLPFHHLPHLSIWKLIFFFKSKFLNKILGNFALPPTLPTYPLFFTLTTWSSQTWFWLHEIDDGNFDAHLEEEQRVTGSD